MDFWLSYAILIGSSTALLTVAVVYVATRDKPDDEKPPRKA